MGVIGRRVLASYLALALLAVGALTHAFQPPTALRTHVLAGISLVGPAENGERSVLPDDSPLREDQRQRLQGGDAGDPGDGVAVPWLPAVAIALPAEPAAVIRAPPRPSACAAGYRPRDPPRAA